MDAEAWNERYAAAESVWSLTPNAFVAEHLADLPPGRGVEDLELHYEGPHVVAAAPKEAGAHDDYCDSLAIGCMMSQDFTAPTVEVANNPFYER